MNQKEPLVSVIMPAYNAEKYISQSIESVINQSYQNWELLITDDRSSDNTQRIVEKYCIDDKRIKLFINKENGGAGVARNNSIKEANGRFIAFLDSDDQWLPEKLIKQISFMLKNNFAFTFTAYQKLEQGKLKGIITPPKFTTYNKLLSSNVIGCLTAIYDAEMVGKQYMPLIRKRQDMGLWLSILKNLPKAYSLTEVLAIYRTDSGMSQNKLLILRWQWCFYRDEMNLSYLSSIKNFCMYLYFGFKKYNS